MAHILSFPQRSAVGARRAGTSGRSAEIVIFPGVRYERHDDAAAAVRPARKDRTQKARSRERNAG